MSNGDVITLKLAELLRHSDDLDKISALKSELTRKKAAVDAQLKHGLSEQLQLTQAGMGAIHDGQRLTNLIKDEMMKIDKLCAEAQTMIQNFPEINSVAQAHRNFAQVETTKTNIETFDQKLDRLFRLLDQDEEIPNDQPNLIRIHYELSQLRNIRDDAMAQIKRANDASLVGTLREHFKRLDDAIFEFDDHIKVICSRLIPLTSGDGESLVVRLAIIIQEEEKFDNRIKELQEAQRDHKDLASRFQSLATGPKKLRGYKDKFVASIKDVALGKIEESNTAFMADPDKLEKSVRWYFNDLNVVKMGMTSLMPKKWKIFDTYVTTYHLAMHDWLLERAQAEEVTPMHMLAIIHWKDKYYAKMEKLGVPATHLSPPLPGGHDSDLVREYRQLIVAKVEQWMTAINKTDQSAFLSHTETALEHDANGHLRSKTLSDMWRMLREQLIVASSSELNDVTEGVTDAMFRALKTRTDMWQGLITAELTRYSKAPAAGEAAPEGLQGLQDWLIALANDQIACIDDPSEGELGFLSSFKRDYESVVSRDYALSSADAKFDMLKAGLTSLSFTCITVFAKLIITVDFRTVLSEIFTPPWLAPTRRTQPMGQIASTFDDYLADYGAALPELMRDILVEELAKQLLLAYLGCVRNRGAKFRRASADTFNERVRDDVLAVFRFFEKWPASTDAVKEMWRAVEGMTQLLEVEKHAFVGEFEAFLEIYWDVRVSWVEALLRARDDVDWSPIGDGKTLLKACRAKAVEGRVEGRVETVFSEVD